MNARVSTPRSPADGAVIQMADAQQARPHVQKRDYRHVMTLGSASQWTGFNLDQFNVHFDRHVFDRLPDAVLKYTPQDLAQKGTGRAGPQGAPHAEEGATPASLVVAHSRKHSRLARTMSCDS